MERRDIRLLLLEDSAADAELIVNELERGGMHVVAHRVDGADVFRSALAEFAPQVVVCDHALASFDTRSALAMVRALRPTAPVIVVSGAMSARDITAVMRGGAEDVILKEDLSSLPRAVEASLETRAGLLQLSPRQLEVLRLVAMGHTTPSIAAQLGLSVKTVGTHRGEIMKRLGIHDLARLVRFAIRVGLISASD